MAGCVVAPHGAGPGVVGGRRENGPELVGEAAQVGDAGVDALPGVEGVGDAEVALRARHQLHQALGSGGRLRGCAVPGLDGDDGVHQVGINAVPLGGRGDDAGERPRASLGRARKHAGGDGDEQQEYKATAGEATAAWRARKIPHARRGPVKDPALALRRAGPELAGDLPVFFAPRLGLALPAGSRRNVLDDVVDGFLGANEREPGLGGDHDGGQVVVADAARFYHRDMGRVDEE